MKFHRYAIYFTPDPGPLADFGAAWLGWDCEAGRSVPHPDIDGLPATIETLTDAPRKYGLHGTIKPPFRLADEQTPEQLAAALRKFCDRQTPIRLDGLKLNNEGRFVALMADGDTAALHGLAARTVIEFDAFRAPSNAAELSRRRAAGLTPAQERNLAEWGYPYLCDEFRFHITLTGPLDDETFAAARNALAPHVTPLLPRPCHISHLTLAGQAADGMFRTIARYALRG